MQQERNARLIAYYLPQYHPIPENDEWWGKGFTEWTNTAKAKPLFRGHFQPRLPADLGFYDLRVPESRIAQADLAREHGIEGFCYWHYWFGKGKRILERPFQEVLDSGQPDFPFCLGWGNESWTGTWHGCADKMLMEQTYPGKEDEAAHFYHLLKAFTDPRYLKIDGRPVFLVYKPHQIPDAKSFTDHWQELARKEGLKGIFFVGEDWTLRWNPNEHGFDASVPHSPGMAFWKLKTHLSKQVTWRLVDRFNEKTKRPKVFKYKDFIEFAAHELSSKFEQFPSLLPNWDNTPRCGSAGYILRDCTPELFRQFLRKTISQVSDRVPDKKVIFVKSWNEWAEGNYLEPDMKYGKGYLEVCREEVFSK